MSMHQEVFYNEIEFATPQYDAAIRLRDEVLRKPLGLAFTEEQLAGEYDSWHLGAYNIDLDILACLVIKPLDEDIAKIRQVAVRPDLHKKGIGTKLSRFAESYVQQKGFKKVELNARKEAVDFYKRLGYKVQGKMFEEIGIPHYKMVKKL